MIERRLTVRSRVHSFRCALQGVWAMLRSQHNAWLHALATLVVFGIGACFGLTKAEWCWIVLAVMTVWTAEALNTAFEFLADVASPEFHPLVAKAKNVAAGAVLISAVGATTIGVVIMGPYILEAVQRL